MYTKADLKLFALNPYLPGVNFYQGSLWLAEEVMDDIESFCGALPTSDHPRDVLLFIQNQCKEMKKPTPSQEIAQVNLAGFCTLMTIKHAIEVRMFGPEAAGDFRDDLLVTQFFCIESSATSMTLH
ncbi:hypothetical protein ABIC83_002986 [Roseateles asaccharophilus]|uniref:hypothetical protein n=1 Tax=Roseateles asaccharophilus TaxID=582607 RepID=UPI0038340B2E